MVETITKKECKSYGKFGEGCCEFCLDAYECEKTTFAIKEAVRTPEKDWLEKGMDIKNLN